MRVGDFYILFLLAAIQRLTGVSAETSQGVLLGEDGDRRGIIFQSGWDVLGPFRLGTRGIIIPEVLNLYISLIP